MYIFESLYNKIDIFQKRETKRKKKKRKRQESSLTCVFSSK